MNKPVQIGLTLLVLLLVMLSANWFYKNFSWVIKKEEVGFQGIARTNNLLAAEFFLRKMGVKVQQANSLSAFRNLPAVGYTIVIATQRETINKELSRQLLNWVKAGGHLIIEAKYYPDYTAARKNKSPLPPAEYDDELLKDDALFSIRNKADDTNADIPVRLSLGKNNTIEVNFPYYKTLVQASSSSTPIWQVDDELGRYLMQYPIGRGLLTVLTSSAIFKNKAIADYDHAYFLHYLVSQTGHNAGVWLIRVDDMPPLWQWLWQNAGYAMVSLSALFFIWLWRMPFRFGPVLNDMQAQRRSLQEHLRAGAYYRWHNDQSVYLLQQVQNRLWAHIKKVHPAVPYDDQQQACKMLAKITGIKLSLITEALLARDQLSENKLHENEFTKLIKVLELIKQRL